MHDASILFNITVHIILFFPDRIYIICVFYILLGSKIEYLDTNKLKTRSSFRWISSTDTYKPHLAFISAQMLERERERERESVREIKWEIIGL